MKILLEGWFGAQAIGWQPFGWKVADGSKVQVRDLGPTNGTCAAC